MTSAQLAEVMKKLDEVSKRQDEYNNQYLSYSYNTKPTDSSVPASFSDATSAQGLLLDDLNKMVATLRALFTKSNQSKIKSNRESNSNQPIVHIHQARSRLIRNQTKIKSTDFSRKFDSLL